MSGAVDQFRQAINNAGLTAPDEIIADGKIHRFSTSGKARDDSDWYVCYLDGTAAGSFGCWREGLQFNWCAKSQDVMSAAERDAQPGPIHIHQITHPKAPL